LALNKITALQNEDKKDDATIALNVKKIGSLNKLNGKQHDLITQQKEHIHTLATAHPGREKMYDLTVENKKLEKENLSLSKLKKANDKTILITIIIACVGLLLFLFFMHWVCYLHCCKK
jgi:hypothetical protein